MFAFVPIFRRGSNVIKKEIVKKILLTDIRFPAAEVVECPSYLFVYTFLSAAFFVALSVVIQKVSPLNQKDVGMRCNEGPNVRSSKVMYYQPIFLQNDCVCRDP